MDKIIFCLANSYKHGGRCIAGVEVLISDGELSIVKSTYGIPNWLRPVSRTSAGEIPNHEAQRIKVFSIVKIHNVEFAGNGAHSEDCYYKKLEILGDLNPSDKFLATFSDTWHNCIFGNRGKAVTPEDFNNSNYSIMLIRTIDSSIYLDTRYTPKPRIKFQFCNHYYDLPITDPILLDKLKNNSSLYREYKEGLYIVVSLGVEHDGWHSKLAATIIIPAQANIREKLIVESTQKTSIRQVRTDNDILFQKTIKEKDLYKNISEENEKLINSLLKLPELKTNISTDFDSLASANRKSTRKTEQEGCYIATAIYGSYDCPEVWTLRRFRDKTLSSYILGKLFIKTYYTVSPVLVRRFGSKKMFVKIVKPILDRIVVKLRYNGYKSTPYND